MAHGAVNRLQRPALAGEATKPVSIGYVEIDSDPGLSPEGRLALAEDGPADSGPLMGRQSHRNGAIELIESVLCVPDADWGTTYVAMHAICNGLGAVMEQSVIFRPRRTFGNGPTFQCRHHPSAAATFPRQLLLARL